MFKTLKFTRKVENILMLIFTAIFLIYISLSPDMSIDSLKGVLVIGVTVGIIYGLVAVGISLIYTGLDVVNFSHGEFFMIGAFTGLTVYNFLVDGELVGGGIIPKKDMEVLENKGVGKLFGPGTPVQETIDYITNWVKSNRR